ncbi:MAG TPA: SRPBCC family protein [Burkholderiales bacterium]|nr:SRPBCC family protein [Burkholderiales bacterium]
MTATVVEPGTIRFERLLPGPVERVWAFITESDKRARWLAGGEFELRVGGKVRLEFDHACLSSDKIPPAKYKDMGKPRVDGVMTRYEPMRVLAHTWAWDGSDTEVTYELSPRGQETLLVITHRRMPSRDGTLSVMSGWDAHTGILEDVLRGVEPRPFWRTHAALEKQYSEAVT